jgi:hypothetical protein
MYIYAIYLQALFKLKLSSLDNLSTITLSQLHSSIYTKLLRDSYKPSSQVNKLSL